MELTVLFGEQDKYFVQIIEAYAKENDISFCEAVKDLFEKALNGLKMERENF